MDKYNATLDKIEAIHEDLRIFRVRPDFAIPQFVAGQYGTLGLGLWEPRVAGVQPEMPPHQLDKLVKRAYSLSCSLFDEAEQLIRAQDCPYLEFYIALVRHADHPPALTPRLFSLEQGRRLFVGAKIVGRYVLQGIRPHEQVVLMSTGTGEAPHNAMIAELLAGGHTGPIVCAACARWRRDFGYIARHRQLEQRYANYRYLTLTTRELENTDPQCPGYLGRVYLQDYVGSGSLERDTGISLDPHLTHLFLCGSPAMIGFERGPADEVAIAAGSMLEVLLKRGFTIHGDDRPGKVRFEKFW